ncbi:hypothetical protein Patl1_30646 [Pistacia atlantica]|uniref:Uncharacterized protein n=1 Tax=Pistacia atlantica TaxID=434234 RepID=A0ACC1AE78_9ROSI|nr:hypothetical protein Patl1_30646 [Pistacia atlantica]
MPHSFSSSPTNYTKTLISIWVMLKDNQISARMRVLVVALILMTVSSCLATNRRILLDVSDQQAVRYSRVLIEDENNVKVEYSPNDENDHHNCPRPDFNHDNCNGTGSGRAG